MPISFVCPSCHQKLKVPDSAAGRTGKCPGCGLSVDVPASSVPVILGVSVTPDPDIDPSPCAPVSPIVHAARDAIRATARSKTGYFTGRPIAPDIGDAERESAQCVKVVDIDIPIESLVWLIIRLWVAHLIIAAYFALGLILLGVFIAAFAFVFGGH